MYAVDEVVSECKVTTAVGPCGQVGCIEQCLLRFPTEGELLKAYCSGQPPQCLCDHTCL